MLTEKQTIHIAGAGLCGSLLALRMAQRGYQVKLFEKRPDLRTVTLDAGRSINLALSPRGLRALSRAGLDDDVKALCIPMHGRLMHDTQGNIRMSRYSGRESDYINSISRPGLNALLLNELEKHDNAKIYFECPVQSVDFEKNMVHFGPQRESESFEFLFGTDGVGSAVRRSMMPWSGRIRFDYSQSFLEHGYKELEIPPGPNNSQKIEKNVLHIWPRGDFMLIALPNLDGSFTVTLFLSYIANPGFDNLDSDQKIMDFFKTYFPDVVGLIPELIQDFHQNPTAPLSTIKCSPWKMPFSPSLLLGDAAHAIVPFYGQGMNSSFEDVSVFEDFLDKSHEDMNVAMETFSKNRKSDADAIADLAIDNFYEMRDHVDNPGFIKKRQVEMILEKEYPDYYSKYSLVTFRPDLPYHKAMNIGRAQDQYILDALRNKEVGGLDIDAFYPLLQEKFIKSYRSHS